MDEYSNRSLTYSQYMKKKEQEAALERIEKPPIDLSTEKEKEDVLDAALDTANSPQLSFSEYMAQKERKNNDIGLKVIFVEESDNPSLKSSPEVRTPLLLTCTPDQPIGYILNQAIHHISHGPDCHINDGIELTSVCEELSNIRLGLQSDVGSIFKHGDIARVICTFPSVFVISQPGIKEADENKSLIPSTLIENGTFEPNSSGMEDDDICDEHAVGGGGGRQIQVTISFVEHGAAPGGAYSDLRPKLVVNCDRGHPVSWLLSEALRSCESEFEAGGVTDEGEATADNNTESNTKQTPNPLIEVFYLRLPPSIVALDLSEDIGNFIDESVEEIFIEAVCNSMIDHSSQMNVAPSGRREVLEGVASLKSMKESLKQWWYACDDTSTLPEGDVALGKTRVCIAGYTDAPGRNTGSHISFGLSRKIADAMCASDPIAIETWFALFKTRKDYLSFCKLLQRSRSFQIYRPQGASFTIWAEFAKPNKPLVIGGLSEFREWAKEQDLTTESVHQLAKMKKNDQVLNFTLRPNNSPTASDDKSNLRNSEQDTSHTLRSTSGDTTISDTESQGGDAAPAGAAAITTATCHVDSHHNLHEKKKNKKVSLSLVRVAAHRVLKSLCEREASMRYDSFTAFPAGTCQGGDIPDVPPDSSGFVWRQEPVILL